MKPGEDARQRLEALNRERPISNWAARTTAGIRRPKHIIPLKDAAPGTPIKTEFGTCWHVQSAPTDFQTDKCDTPHRLTHVIDGAGCRLPAEAMHEDLAAAARGPAQALLFADIETCGFAGSMIFLIGTMQVKDDKLVCDQFLARDYAEEPAILSRLAGQLRRSNVLVTFNGKAFDWPCLNDRAAVHRVPLASRPLAHCDVLHEARRRWRSIVPDCRLVTLERMLCGRARANDIPSSQIPDVYHRFVKTGHAAVMRQVLLHNLYDLLTLSELLTMLLADELDGEA